MANDFKKRMKYTRQAIMTNTFYQMPRFLTAGEFAGKQISNHARILYTLLFDRNRISVRNGWFDDNGEVYMYFKRDEMEERLGLSERTIAKVIQELKDFNLIEEKQQGLNRPNKIYLLSPVVGAEESPEPYLDPEPDYNPEKEHESGYESEPVNITAPDPQELRPRTRNNYASEPVKNTLPGGVNSTGVNAG